jgi:homoserine kinase type II
MNRIYFLYHIDEDKVDGYHHGKIVVLYSTLDLAKAAIDRFRDKPGFRDYPERWKIYPRTIDRDSWANGFVTETHERIA